MKKTLTILSLAVIILLPRPVDAQRVTERLNRGLVAVRISPSQVFLSWRMLGYDADDISFNLYRDGVKINSTPIATVTNYTDATSTPNSYTVKTVLNGIETGEQNSCKVLPGNYFDIVMNVPETLTMPNGTTCSYSPADCSTGDVDGDGEYEIVVKWDPSNAHDNSQSGYTGNVYLDVYKLNGTQLCRIDLGKNIRAGAHYTQFQVADFDGDGKAEIICKTAPGTRDGLGNYISKGPAATASHTTDYRNSNGYILSGPEYLTVFSGLTGAELATAEYSPLRGTVSSWGDSYGNRVDRFLAGTAYIDGILPTAIMCRGYYTRATIAAWNYRNGTLSRVWLYDSGTTSGVGLYGQGNHNMSIGDVDNDGKDEIIWGAGAVDNDGKFMYSTGLGHGDAMHMSDLDPDRKGLEVWEMHESTGAAYGEEMHDAKTGAILWGNFTGSDNGRGLAVNVIAGNRGFEMWSASGTGTMSKNGTLLSTSRGSMNFRIYWDGDLQDEMLDGITISKYGVGTLLSATGCASNNGTKSTPNLSADILGDWREELILRTEDNTRLRVFTTTIPTAYRTYTLMHDPVYRAGITWQNTAYNQPPHLGYYMGDDMDVAPASAAYNNDLRWKTGSVWDNTTACWTDSLNKSAAFKNGNGVVFDNTSGLSAAIAVSGLHEPKRVLVNSVYNVELNGAGSLAGRMELKKIGSGALKLNNTNTYTGGTSVWNGDFYNNGNLTNSVVNMHAFSKAGGKGIFGNDVFLNNLSALSPGTLANETAKLTFAKNLKESGTVTYNFDFVLSNNVVNSHDTLVIGGNWILSGKSAIQLNTVNGSLPAGSYVLVKCAGAVSGDLSKIKITGVPTYLGYSLVNTNGNITLKISPPAYLSWRGTIDNKWDNAKTANWSLFSDQKYFSINDSVLFNDEASIKSVVLNESVAPASMLAETADTYSISGTGSIDGTASLTKKGDGKLSLLTANKYTGKTYVNGGTLEINSIANGGVASSIGASAKAAANVVLNGGKLSYTGASASTDRGFTIGALGGGLSISNAATTLSPTGQITGTGRLTKDGAGTLALSIANNHTGGTSINAGTISLLNDLANTSGLGTSDTIVLSGGTLSMFDSNTTDNTSNWNLKIPTGTVGTLNTDGKSTISGIITGGGKLNYYTNFTGNLLSSDASGFMGVLNVTTDADGGNFVFSNSKGFEKAKVYLNNNVTMFFRNTADITIPIGDLSGAANSVIGAGGSGACTIYWQIGARNASSAFNGKITNTQYSGSGAVAAILKVGNGTWTLTNNNTYSGGTTINDGVVMVNNTTGSGLGTGLVTVNFDATLSGSGAVAAPVIVTDGGTIEPGNGIGKFTVNNNLEMQTGSVLSVDIDKSNFKNDVLAVTGTFTMQGKLLINPGSGTVFAAGDAFKIINGTVSGLPAEIIPAIPADGLEWDLTDFGTNGMLKVKTATGISELELDSNIFPVPCKNKLSIHLAEPSDNLKISIHNLTGSELCNYSYDNQTRIELNVQQLPKGIYLLQLTMNNKSFSKKIVKE